MLKKCFILASIFVQISAAQNLSPNFYKRFEGSINGRYNITMNLVRIDSALSGNYYYNNKGELINFIRSSIDSSGNVYLEEDAGYDENYNSLTTGIFKGKFSAENKIEGTWENPESSKPLVFYLEEKYPAGSTQFDVNSYSRSYNKFGSASIAITELQIKNFNQQISKKLNDYLTTSLLAYSLNDPEGTRYNSIDDLMEDFINSYITDIVEDSSNYKEHTPFYEYGSTTEILFNSDYLLSLQKVDYSYLGGAHPNTFIELVNFDLSSGEIIKLENIFKPGYEKTLNIIGEKKFREYYNLDSDKSLEEEGFWFENNKFSLNENFSLTKAGIKFLYNAYEVGAYALGAPEVYIPFTEIEDLIKEDSIIGLMK